MLPEVAGHGAVRRLRQHGLAVGRHQHARHQPERAEALRHRVGLHVAVVVLARPDIAARPFQRRSHHVVDQPVLVGEPAPSNSGLNSAANTSAKMSLKRPS